jgi:hypothetical protein
LFTAYPSPPLNLKASGKMEPPTEIWECWNTEELLKDSTRQLKDQPIQFISNYKNAVAPKAENQDPTSKYVFTFLTNNYTVYWGQYTLTLYARRGSLYE